ncbi:16S rRNA (adenine(1518)-N(6)/adenine(1519)-N(6))-dimethyltransferase RsmA [Holospora curviuscula]|uniref:Ribosomal RNA small subunit methyltransferase A n=1 Tax=Holospora curviuscula TaxID=1082868 RepID=A0A2S5R788_9PROT|nr:16S rRNA (adenine(1518)-N(6)/adenine(1519)-N(6))-dimethyltransferase RsmA [Holospora curviuscula]PPE03170.1 Ribosomal RNA small subunit methyltransferase A [Holospora curviuscula]
MLRLYLPHQKHSTLYAIKGYIQSAVAIKALKRWGQHFLNSPLGLTTITETVSAIQKVNGLQAITEIGPGLGALTDCLHPLTSTYYVMEQDQRFAPRLSSYDPPLNILWGDALRQEWAVCPKSVLVGNLPYNISIPIILRWLRYSERFPEAIFMVQKEVGKRIISKPSTKAYGRLAVMIQSMAHVRWILTLGPESFVPQPKVDSCVLHLKRNFSIPKDLDTLESVLKHCFSQRRKILKNALARISVKFPTGFLEEGLARVGASMHYRPEMLTVDQYIKFSEYIKDSEYVAMD